MIGGGIGHYYLISRAVLPSDVEVVYTCKDTTILSEYGRKLFPEAIFCDDDSYLRQRYDFILVSGSLQYIENWRITLQQIVNVAEGYIFVTRLFTVQGSASFVVMQHAYETEYLSWVLNRAEFLQYASDIGLELVREFIVDDSKVYVYKSPEPFDFRGFLFRVKSNI